jgi:hypothetical protein
MEKRSRKEIQDMAQQCLEQAGPDGYLLGGTASGTYTERGAENFIALVEVAEAYGRSIKKTNKPSRNL